MTATQFGVGHYFLYAVGLGLKQVTFVSQKAGSFWKVGKVSLTVLLKYPIVQKTYNWLCLNEKKSIFQYFRKCRKRKKMLRDVNVSLYIFLCTGKESYFQ